MRRRNPKPRNLGEAIARHKKRYADLLKRRKRLAQAVLRHSRLGYSHKKARLVKAHDRLGAAMHREKFHGEELVRKAEAKYDAERAHRPVKKNGRRRRRVSNPRRVRNPIDVERILPVVALGGAAWAAYEFLYKPWKIKHDLEVLTKAQIDANLKKGMSLTEAADNAVAGACVAGATVYKVPPELSGSICKGVGILAVAGAKAAVKGAVIAGKVIGKDIGKAAGGVKTAAKAVGSTAKKAVHSISHGFGLWGVDVDELGDIAAEPFGSRSSGLFRTTQSRARPPGRTKQRRLGAAATGAGFYLRHL